jgi:hypothetical protein
VVPNSERVYELELLLWALSAWVVTANATAVQVRDALGAQTAVTRDRLTVAASISSGATSSRRAASTAAAAEVAAIDGVLEGLGRLLRQGAADAVSPLSALSFARFLSGLTSYCFANSV